MKCRLALAILALAAAPAPAQTGFQGDPPPGEAPGPALERLGVIGRWARDCAQGVVSGNPHVVYRRRGDEAEYTVYFPGNSETTRGVTNVREVSPGRIALRFVTKSGDTAGSVFDVTMAKQGNRQRVVESKDGDGKIYIRDGIVLGSGQENPWQTRCGDR